MVTITARVLANFNLLLKKMIIGLAINAILPVMGTILFRNYQKKASFPPAKLKP